MMELKSIPITSDSGDVDRALFLEHDWCGLLASPANRYEGRDAEVLPPVPPEAGLCPAPSPVWVVHCESPTGGSTR